MKSDVLREIADVAANVGQDVWSQYQSHVLDPYPAFIERFGLIEQAFVVARLERRIVFFDDVEETFGTATEVGGRLVDCADYFDLRVALREAKAGR